MPQAPLSFLSTAAGTWTLAFVLVLCASLCWHTWLLLRQIRHVARHRHAVPDAFASRVDLTAHQKAADYTIARARLGLLHGAWDSAILVGWTLLGGLSALHQLTVVNIDAGLAQQLTLLVAFALIGSALDLPWSWYQTFRLEQRFGFNTSTLSLWLSDLVKSALLGALIGLPLAALVLWLMAATGTHWWLWAWGAWATFNLLALLIYPLWIAPLFNRFTPLADEALRERLQTLLQRCGFAAKGLFVMDGSRRSAHGNAYFTGFGASRRVVLFDTLLTKLSPAQIEAVLAHELGHFHHRHVVQRIVLLMALSLLGFAVLGWVGNQAWFYQGLGVDVGGLPGNAALTLLLFGLVLPVFTPWLTPIFAQWSRRHEFQADAYAASVTRAEDLASALLQLYQDNASTLTPDPLYMRVTYSHPAATERLQHLQTLSTPLSTAA